MKSDLRDLKSPQTLLALETSCDESAVAILRGDRPPPEVLVSLVSSQIDLHRLYGGVVPEVASRNHALKLRPLVEEAVAKAGIPLDRIDAFAATRGPGLASSLLVGHSMAKALAAAAGKPFLSINHMEGHLLSPFLESELPDQDQGAGLPPHLALIVSGGHTLLVEVQGLGDYRLVGRTIDDAAGEAFDKVARLLGLPYPGGPEIEKLAREGNPKAFDFPRSMRGTLDFSFSGLKTAVRYALPDIADLPAAIPDLCASFQQAVIDVLVEKAIRAAHLIESPLVTLSGGVSCNRALSETLRTACAAEGLRFLPCPPALSTDNAAMIAFAGWLRFLRGEIRDHDEDIDPNLPLVKAEPES